MNRKKVKKPAEKSKARNRGDKNRSYTAVPFVLFAVAVLTESCLLLPSSTGVVGRAVHDLLCGVFGAVSFLIPAGLFVFALNFFAIRRNKATAFKITSLAIFTLAFSACQSVTLDPSVTENAKFIDYYNNGVAGIGGGVVGGMLGKLAVLAFDRVFSVVILLLLCVASITFFIGTKNIGIWSWVALKIKKSKKLPVASKATAESDNTSSVTDITNVPSNIVPVEVKTTVSEAGSVKSSPSYIDDPFIYGDGFDRPSADIDLYDAPTDDSSEMLIEPIPVAPVQNKTAAPVSQIPLDAEGNPRAYSPFANPSFKEPAKTAAKPQQSEEQAPSRSYSPFSDPFASMNEAQRDRNIPSQSAIACGTAKPTESLGISYIQSTPDTQYQPKTEQKKTGLGRLFRNPETVTVNEDWESKESMTESTEFFEKPAEVKKTAVTPISAKASKKATPLPQEPVVSYDAPPFDLDEEEYEEPDDTSFDDPTLMEQPHSDGDIRQVYGSEPRYPDYVYPPFDLLDPVKPLNQISEAEVMEIRNTLLEKLSSFRIEANLSGYSVGPTITRYEITPGPGVKVKQITALTDDLALALQSDGVRIATVSGKSVIGIEVPNEKVSVVSLRGLLESREFINAKSSITVCVGLTVTGKPVYMDIDDMPHVLIAGETKSGKSVAINCMILSLLYRASPDEVQLILIDPKRVELNIYSKIPHLVMPVIDDPKRAAAALRWAVNEMDRRYMLLDKMGVRNREEYCELRNQDPTLECMPQIIIVIDELADLMLQVREFVEELINRLAAMARACGIHLLVGTQRPSVDIITGLIKANIPARIAFKVSSAQDSRIILGGIGAEKLLGRGDMLYQATGAGRMRIQGAFVSGTEIKRLTKFIIDKNGPADFDPEVLRSLDAEMDKMNKSSKKATYTDDDEDNGTVDGYEPDFDLLCRAIEYILETGKTSTNNIQRVLHVGFNRAADIVDALEDMGFLSRREGNRPRDVQVTWEMYEEWKMRKQM